MINFKILYRCPSCGARTRIRLPAGKKVRVRCGNCGEVLPVDRRGILLTALSRGVKRFFADLLPRILIALTDLAWLIVGLALKPLRLVWRRLPPGLRNLVLGAAFALLLGAFLFLEGRARFSAMLSLVLVIVLAGGVIVLIMRGPAALRDILRRVSGSLFRHCRACGYRYFSWARRCPRCGEE
ncbi:MAG: hypothetical protein A2Z86_01175 [Candidatus Glassbacteria bacterium GWA2_58_10]|uniref:Uncharacterized protein n=1 Tax=Candidatus Glassbacteria bacterium GWA2_58_10 TaxID=1817865 RepID=A0A1F5YDQ4_9BACT|nr:MAG: hypothetical protein A2Z86_01175 [Candidatus Glassbacteria bacterium GWA2_58_10]